MDPDSWSEDDVIPLNSNLFEHHKAALFVSQEKHIAVFDAVITKFIGPSFSELIDKRISKLSTLGLETPAITTLILDEVTPDSSMQINVKEHKIKELVFRYLLKKHGLEGLAAKKRRRN